MADVTIRQMKVSDLDRVVAIWLEANRSAHHFVDAEYWESHLDYMRNVLPNAEVWVYSIDGDIVGFIGLDNGYIAGLFVDSDHRSQSIGHKLISHAKQEHDKLSLCVYQQNTRAISFYTREGFTPIEHRTDPPTAETEIVMSWHR